MIDDVYDFLPNYLRICAAFFSKAVKKIAHVFMLDVEFWESMVLF